MDEHPKPESTMESLGKLPPVFKKNGVVTAASASVCHTMLNKPINMFKMFKIVLFNIKTSTKKYFCDNDNNINVVLTKPM